MTEQLGPTPIRFNDQGTGWHLTPRRLHLQRGLVALALVLVGFASLTNVIDGNRLAGLVMGVLVALGFAVALEPRPTTPPRMFESPDVYGLLLPTHPIKLSLIVLLGLLGLGFCVGPVVAVLSGHGEGSLTGQVAAITMLGVLGALCLVGAAGGLAARRTPHRGVLLTVDGVRLQVQRTPASFPWHECHGLRQHWSRVRSARNHFLTPDDVIANWLTFTVDPQRVEGPIPLSVGSHTPEPTLDVKDLAMDPELAARVCHFYLGDAEARGELDSSAALDRVASIERSLSELR